MSAAFVYRRMLPGVCNRGSGSVSSFWRSVGSQRVFVSNKTAPSSATLSAAALPARLPALSPVVQLRPQSTARVGGGVALFSSAPPASAAAIPDVSNLPTTTTTTALAPASPPLHTLGSVDHSYEEDRIDRVAEPERRAFTYLLLSGIRFAYASCARLLVVKFIATMSASAEVLALAFSEFDLEEIEMGTTLLVSWRGKPIYIRRRNPDEIAAEQRVPMEHLRDQEHDSDRTHNPEFMVVIGICPHLGCVPVPDAGHYNGWFCPCHGSHYDLSGRIRFGPSPLNLEVPPYKFIEKYVILMG